MEPVELNTPFKNILNQQNTINNQKRYNTNNYLFNNLTNNLNPKIINENINQNTFKNYSQTNFTYNNLQANNYIYQNMNYDCKNLII